MTLILRIPGNTQAYLFTRRDVSKDKFDVVKFTYDYINEEAGPDILQDILLYYKFDESSGTRIDSVGNLNLAASGSESSVTGKVGNAVGLSVNGANVAGEALSPSLLADYDIPTTGYTLAFWAKAAADLSAWSQGLLIAFGQTYYDCYFWFGDISYGAPDPPHYLYKFMVTNTGNWETDGLGWDCDDGLSHFFVLWFDPSDNTMHMLVDDTYHYQRSASITHTPGNSFNFGCYQYKSSLSWVDEMGLWGRVLTADECTYLYNSGLGRTLYP